MAARASVTVEIQPGVMLYVDGRGHGAGERVKVTAAEADQLAREGNASRVKAQSS